MFQELDSIFYRLFQGHLVKPQPLHTFSTEQRRAIRADYDTYLRRCTRLSEKPMSLVAYTKTMRDVAIPAQKTMTKWEDEHMPYTQDKQERASRMARSLLKKFSGYK